MNKPGKTDFTQIVRHLIAAMVLLAAMLAGCQGESIIDSVFPTTPKSDTLLQTTEPIINETAPQPTPTSLPVRDLIVWVPPQFDPSTNQAGARLLNQRLEAYERDYPHVNIIVRVKAASGPGGLLETLTGASAVAPESLPALVLLSRADMAQAIAKNLLAPIDELSAVIDEEDWYGFAQEMAIQQGTTYGLPFVSNLLGIVFRAPKMESDQPEWDEVLRRFNQLVFPAGDPEALITLSLYLSAGGEIRDDRGHQMVDLEELAAVLNLYAEGSRRGVFSNGLVEVQNDDQAWDLFQNGVGDGVVTWANRVFSGDNAYQLAMLPSLGDLPYSTGSGWLWCLPSAHEEVHQEEVNLAEYLVASEFLAEWSAASGFFPVRPSSLEGWSDSPLKNTISRMLQSAQLRPTRQMTSAISPELKNSVAEILKGQSTPAESAQKLIERLEVIDAQ